jgi:hypothetical protein
MLQVLHQLQQAQIAGAIASAWQYVSFLWSMYWLAGNSSPGGGAATTAIELVIGASIPRLVEMMRRGENQPSDADELRGEE